MVAAPTSSALRALNYAPGIDQLRLSRGRLRSKRIGELAARIGGSFGAVFTRIDCERAHGVPLYSQVDTFAAEPEGRTIRRDAMPRPDAQSVSRWQILIAAAGQMAEGNLFGRSIIADSRLTDGYCGPDSLALTFALPGGDDNLWTYAFLNTTIGLRAIRACAYGTSIPRLRPDLVAEIPVPQGDETARARVSEAMRRTVEQREIYLAALLAARGVLENLPEMREAHAMCSERKARAVEWSGPMPTLGAWNYASPGEALAFLGRKWNARIGDILDQNGLYYGARSARISCEAPHGVDFVSQRDAFLIRPIPRRVVLPGVPDTMLFVPEGALVLAARGTLGEGEIFGRPVLVAGVLTRLGLTEDLLRLIPKTEYQAVAYAFLSTLVGRRLIRSAAVGTKILNLRFDLLRALPFPSLSSSLKQQVDAYIGKARAARISAEESESEAIRIVEEEVLPAWLA